MARSDEQVLPDGPERSLPTALSRRASRADLVLVSIPLALLAAAAFAVVSTVSLTASAALGTSAALAVMGYALYADAPEN